MGNKLGASNDIYDGLKLATLAAPVGGGGTSGLDGTYLRIDTDNDPLTGDLEIDVDSAAALDVQTVAGVPIFGVDTIAGGTREIGNIHLLHASGALSTPFAPTQAGLIAALAAAVSGDTVWLPSMTIALTTGITLPASVALIGISEESVLQFSGFAGVAVTLAANAIVCGFTVLYNGLGQTNATGIDARFVGALVDDVLVSVYNASASNTGIWTGVTP